MSTGNACPQCGFQNNVTAKFCAECGHTLIQESPVQPLAAPSRTGTVLQGRYRIEQELGRGGFGAVYRAWDANLNRRCAVKENLETSPEAQRQFTREATVLANLSHPNLPRVTDHFFIPDQGQYLVMDFVEGGDLAGRAQQGAIPVSQALDWITQMADALAYMHSRQPPIFHRDIKPANIRITPEGRAFLVDFGLVKVSAPNLKTTVGARAITPGYAPPEQYGRGTTDARTDVYALGATLYKLVTGIEPPESVQRLSGESVRPAHLVNPQVPLHISQAIERAIALDPNQRFQSAAEFKGALRDFASVSRPPAQSAAPLRTVVVEPAASHPSAARAPSASRVSPATYTPALAAEAPRKGLNSKLLAGVAVIGVLVLVLGAVALLGVFAVIRGQESAKATETAQGATLAAFVRSTATAQSQATTTAGAYLTATSHVQETASAQAAETATSQAKVQETAAAQARITATAQAWIAATFQARESVVNSLLANRKKVFGPQSDALAHEIDDYIEGYEANVDLMDFVIEATFYNPYAVAKGSYDFGFTLRDTDANNQFRLVVASDKSWELTNNSGDPDGTTIAEGEIPWLNTNPDASNSIRLICKGDRGYFYINDQLVAELDLSARMFSGDVTIGIGFFNGDEIAGEKTRYENFTIWSLP